MQLLWLLFQLVLLLRELCLGETEGQTTSSCQGDTKAGVNEEGAAG
jgi:hypothetical protein